MKQQAWGSACCFRAWAVLCIWGLTGLESKGFIALFPFELARKGKRAHVLMQGGRVKGPPLFFPSCLPEGEKRGVLFTWCFFFLGGDFFFEEQPLPKQISPTVAKFLAMALYSQSNRGSQPNKRVKADHGKGFNITFTCCGAGGGRAARDTVQGRQQWARQVGSF